MLMRTLIAIIVLGLLLVSMASGGDSISVPVDARATYLRTSNDPGASLPTIVDLGAPEFPQAARVGISFAIPSNLPSSGYSYRCVDLVNFPYLDTEGFTLNIERGVGLLGVFSASDTLLTPDNHPRVPGATNEGIDLVSPDTPNTFFGTLSTDMPEDFLIYPPTDLCVAVPPDASHLFLGVGDSFYGDNCSPLGPIEVTIESSVKGLIEGAIRELSATQATIVDDPSGVGYPEEAIENLGEAITRLESSRDSFPEGDPCGPLGEDCKVGKKFFQALKGSVGAIFAAIDEGGISDSGILEGLEGVVLGQILKAANSVAATAIEDAKDASGDTTDIAQAEFHFAMAELQTADGVSVGIAALMFFDEAVGSYKKAWLDARKAVGDCGPPGRP